MDELVRPPMGVMPRWLHNEMNFDDLSSESRLNDLKSAINRYTDARLNYPMEWIREKEEIEKAQKQ